MSQNSINQEININNIDGLLAAIDGVGEPRPALASQQRSKFAHLPPVIRQAAERSEARKIATNSEAIQTSESFAPLMFEAPSGTPSLVEISTPSNPTPQTPTLTPLQKAKAQAEPLLTYPWRKLTRYQKLARAFVAADEAGGISFTINLSDALERTLFGCPDPTRLMSHYINRELKTAIGAPVPYGFRFEVSPSGRLHLHGVLLPASLDEDHILAIDRALGRAGGKLKANSLRRNTQSYLGTLYDGLGWFAYCQKNGTKTAKILGTEKVTFISTELTRLAKSD